MEETLIFQFLADFLNRKMTIYWKDMRNRTPIIEAEIPRRLEALGSPWRPEVDLSVDPEVPMLSDGGRPDFLVRLRWGDQEYSFAAEAKARSSPKMFEAALEEIRKYAAKGNWLPMIVVPYLDERRLNRLVSERVSGLDLCGNGLAIVPGRLMLLRSGQRNVFPESQPTRYAYRGATSIVPRVFLSRPAFNSVTAIREEIQSKGGSVALSTVSKALARMKDDVLIERSENRIALLQADALLDKLAQEYRPPKLTREISVRLRAPMGSCFARANHEDEQRPALVLSGTSSQDRYAAGVRDDQPLAYCEDLDKVRLSVDEAWEETERFANLLIAETNDRTPFFDARRDTSGITFASPVQAYLELNAGDKRDREMARAIRSHIKRSLQ